MDKLFSTFLGLPVHALVVHAVVVLLPLAAIAAFALAVVPGWRIRFGWSTLALVTVATGSVPVARESGQWLANALHYPADFHHGQLGQLVIFYAVPMWALTVVLVFLERRRRGLPLVGRSNSSGGTAMHGGSASGGSASGGASGSRGRTRRGSAVPVTLVAVACAISAVLCTISVVNAGHTGSDSVWTGRLPAGN